MLIKITTTKYIIKTYFAKKKYNNYNNKNNKKMTQILKVTHSELLKEKRKINDLIVLLFFFQAI